MSIYTVEIVPQFIPSREDGIFTVLYLPPAGKHTGKAILHVPAFAEEMNRARKMVALQARHFASLGYLVMVPDLYGTGDSPGEFGDTSLARWEQDVVAGAEYLEEKGIGEISLWGLRAGGLLAAKIISEGMFEIKRLLLWNPVTAGSHVINQFIKLRLVSEMMKGKKMTTQGIREAVLNGESVNVAGYNLSKDMMVGMEQISLKDLSPASRIRIDWIEVSSNMSKSVQEVLRCWKDRGSDLHFELFQGDAFWTAGEVTIVEKLCNHSTRLFS